MKNNYTKEFLEKQLELWKKKISKRKKWVENIEQYEETVKDVQNYLKILEESVEGISFEDQKFSELRRLSKDHKTEFLNYLNDDNISKFLNNNFFNDVKEYYTNTYWGKQIHEKIQNDFNDENLTTDTLDNLSSGKGPIILYILIEYLNDLHNENIREHLIRFYDNAIKLFRTPHSASSRRGLHFEVCNNNFITEIKDFLLDANKGKYKNNLNATYPYRSKDQEEFHPYENENVALELYGWINLGKEIDDGIVAIYNNKIINYLKILMGLTTIDKNTFFNVYKKYLETYEPYQDPDIEMSNLQKVLYADQFFQYLHELEVEQLHKNIIYYGAPGTGKTYTVLENIKMLTNNNQKFYKMVQFHPSYSYEDFIEGIKPSGIDNNGNIKFDLVDGEFKKFCIEAQKDTRNNYYFIIDEINRAELSRVFGEILFCLEYRFEDNDKKGLIRTPNATLLDEKINNSDNQEESINNHTIYWDSDEKKSYFGIPDNVYVIGTMNDIDRSIDSFDMALRRRFVWKQMDCNYEVIEEWLYDKKINNNISMSYIDACKALNRFITNDLSLSKSYEIGHAYFMKLLFEDNSDNITNEQLNYLWENNIKPLLYEYLRAEIPENEIEDKLKEAKKRFKLEQNDTNS